MSEDHPVIKEYKARIGGADAESVSEDHIVGAMLACAPDARADILRKTGVAADDALAPTVHNEGRPETTNLRQIAQRESLHRRLAQVDKALRRAGR